MNLELKKLKTFDIIRKRNVEIEPLLVFKKEICNKKELQDVEREKDRIKENKWKGKSILKNNIETINIINDEYTAKGCQIPQTLGQMRNPEIDKINDMRIQIGEKNIDYNEELKWNEELKQKQRYYGKYNECEVYDDEIDIELINEFESDIEDKVLKELEKLNMKYCIKNTELNQSDDEDYFAMNGRYRDHSPEELVNDKADYLDDIKLTEDLITDIENKLFETADKSLMHKLDLELKNQWKSEVDNAKQNAVKKIEKHIMKKYQVDEDSNLKERKDLKLIARDADEKIAQMNKLIDQIQGRIEYLREFCEVKLESMTTPNTSLSILENKEDNFRGNSCKKPGHKLYIQGTIFAIMNDNENANDTYCKLNLLVESDELKLWTNDELRQAQKSDVCCQLLIKHVTKTISDEEKKTLRKLFKQYEKFEYKLEKKILCRIISKPQDRVIFQSYIPSSLRDIALKLSHDVPSAGHGGVNATQCRLDNFGFWPKSTKDIERHVKACVICLQFKNRYGPKAPMLRMHGTSRPFERCHIDLVGPLEKSAEGHVYILTVIDARTRYLIAVPIRNKTAKIVAKALFERVISPYGPMETVVSDQGSEFIASIFKNLMEVWKIKHLTTASYSPSSNGLIERANGTLAKILRTLVADKPKQWSQCLYYAVLAYNTAYHRQLGDSPFFLKNMYDFNIPVHIFSPEKENVTDLNEYREKMMTLQRDAFHTVQQHLDATYAREEAQHKKFKVPVIKVGMKVYIYNPPEPGKPSKLQKKFRGPFRVLKVLGPSTLLVKGLSSSKVHKVHTNNIKILEENEIGKSQSRSVRKSFPMSGDDDLSDLQNVKINDENIPEHAANVRPTESNSEVRPNEYKRKLRSRGLVPKTVTWGPITNID